VWRTRAACVRETRARSVRLLQHRLGRVTAVTMGYVGVNIIGTKSSLAGSGSATACCPRTRYAVAASDAIGLAFAATTSSELPQTCTVPSSADHVFPTGCRRDGQIKFYAAARTGSADRPVGSGPHVSPIRRSINRGRGVVEHQINSTSCDLSLISSPVSMRPPTANMLAIAAASCAVAPLHARPAVAVRDGPEHQGHPGGGRATSTASTVCGVTQTTHAPRGLRTCD